MSGKQTSPVEIIGVEPPLFMTADFRNPDGTRYNFEQVQLYNGLTINLKNESGDQLILEFSGMKKSEKEYPIDQIASNKYVSKTLPNMDYNSSSPLINWVHQKIVLLKLLVR